MKTVFITGTSSGIGKSTAKLFQKKGWNVIATMRNPEKEKELTAIGNIIVLKLDVNDIGSIKNSINEAIDKFGKIDVLINNAGYGTYGAFENASVEQAAKQFDVNVFGLMNVTREMLPFFRKQKNGTIVNVASVAGHLASPGFSLYNASKYAVEGFSEALYFELRQFNIKVKVVEPGPIKTDFFGRSMNFLNSNQISDYNNYIETIKTKMGKIMQKGMKPEKVAKTIYKAANSNSCKIHYPVGTLAYIMIRAKKIFPTSVFNYSVRKIME